MCQYRIYKGHSQEKEPQELINMAIARPTRPQVIVLGAVIRVAERFTRADESGIRRKFAHALTIRQASGPELGVDVFLDRDSGESPIAIAGLVGQVLPIVAEVSESSYGASLSFVRLVTDSDLEELAQSVPQLAGK